MGWGMNYAIQNAVELTWIQCDLPGRDCCFKIFKVSQQGYIMLYEDQYKSNTIAFKWFTCVTFFLVLWGLFAAWVASVWQIPLDVFSIFSQELNLNQSLVVGAVYALAASFILVILADFGFYNPVLAFIVVLVGITMFFEFIVGKSQINDSQNLVWLMALPFVGIRDLVTHYMLRHYSRKTARITDNDLDKTRSQGNLF